MCIRASIRLHVIVTSNLYFFILCVHVHFVMFSDYDNVKEFDIMVSYEKLFDNTVHDGKWDVSDLRLQNFRTEDLISEVVQTTNPSCKSAAACCTRILLPVSYEAENPSRKRVTGAESLQLTCCPRSNYRPTDVEFTAVNVLQTRNSAVNVLLSENPSS
jgi:hypothetical protein